MARTFGKLLCTIWSDPDFLALSNDAKVLYLAFTSQSDTTAAGVVPLTERRWIKWLGTDREGASKALDELVEGRFVVVDDDTAEVWIRSFIKHDQRFLNSKLAHSVHRALAEIRSIAIKDAASVENSRCKDITPGGREDEGPSDETGRAMSESDKGNHGSTGLGSCSTGSSREELETKTPQPETANHGTPIAADDESCGADDGGGGSLEVTAARVAEWAGHAHAMIQIAEGRDVKPDKLGPWKAKELLNEHTPDLERIAEWANNHRAWSGLDVPRDVLAAAALGQKQGLANFPERPPVKAKPVERITPEERTKLLREAGAPEKYTGRKAS